MSIREFIEALEIILDNCPNRPVAVTLSPDSARELLEELKEKIKE